jgi:general secretion pathway protein D
MIRLLISLFALCSVSCFAVTPSLDDPLSGGTPAVLPPLPVQARPLPTKMADGKFSLTMDKIPASQLVMLFYDQCEKRGLVFDPSLNAIDTVLTLKTPSMSCADTKRILLDALNRAGVSLEARSGYDVAVQARQREEIEGWQELIYRPRFRDPLELAQFATIAIRKGRFAHQRAGVVQQTGSSAAQTPFAEIGTNGASITGKRIDKLVFFGPPAEVKAVESLLSRLDMSVPQIEIRAGIYEFQTGKAEGSAVTAALNLFSGKLGVTVSGGANTIAGGTLKISLPNIDAALSLLDKDSRFQYVSQPKVSVRDGEEVNFTSGQDVRVDGSVTLTGSGQSVASKTTLTAGVTLQATPFIRGDVVDLTVNQQVSDFVSSPNNDPSVMRRQLTTRLSMQPGFVYVIGGLKTNRNTTVKQSFFGIPIGSSGDKSDTEVLLLLTVKPEQI